MDDDVSNSIRRMSSRTRKVAPRMAAALASSDNRTQVCVFLIFYKKYIAILFKLRFNQFSVNFQAAIARLEALENDYAGMETVETNDDDEASLDDDDEGLLHFVLSFFLFPFSLFSVNWHF